MTKNIIRAAVAATILAGLAVTPAFAAVTSTSTKVRTNVTSITSLATIQCVGNAVSVREGSLGTAIGVYTNALSSAYTTRAGALAAAYSSTSTVAVRAGIKAAWSGFTSSVKSARGAWSASKSSAWSTFRTAVKACKAPATITDTSNSVSDVSGQ